MLDVATHTVPHPHRAHLARRVLQATVEEHLQHGIVYATANQRLIIPSDLMAVADVCAPPTTGTAQSVALLSSRDPRTGLQRASRRGAEFVSGVLEHFDPGCVEGTWVGASNSWAVVKMDPHHKAAWLEVGGTKARAVQSILGLKRLSIFEAGQGSTDAQRVENELRHVLSCIWTHARLLSLEENRAVITAPRDETHTRAALPMLRKIMPGLSIELVQ